ncbi:MAG: tetratricopeptide repeat protein, partial [Rudaea sp.]|nr:tetratricopeptide repeat protein [Rudaea sp.]
MNFSKFAVLAVASGALLAACTQPAPPAKVAAKPDRDPSAAVTAIRAAGSKVESAVEVKPLRDPAVDGLLKQARDLEAQGQFAPALDAVRKAEKIAGPGPDILQFEAE